MGTLGENEINLAKSRAKRHLERSIIGLCISLGLDSESVTSSMTIPVGEENPHFTAYSSLISQLSALEKIS